MMRRFIVLFLIAVASARADTASRLYEQGKYEEALGRYRKAAGNQPENWPLFYDLGAAAYKAGRPDEAANAFERALGSKDPALQAKALYNLGNSYYRLGEVAEKRSREQAMPQYEHSLKSYESSLTMNPRDEDTKFNLEMVKKKIEELKKQQRQQKNNQQDRQQNNQQQKQNQSQNQQQQQNPQQSDAEKQKQQEQQNQQQQQAAKEKQEAEAKQQQEQKQQQQEQQQQAKNGQPESYDKMQAAALLDNLRENEKAWNFFPELLSKTNELSEPEKDW
jgi:Ca-activated chloride channel homolog